MLSDQVKEGLLSFVGYGRPSAPIWFVGAEEGLGGAMTEDDERANQLARGKWQEFMDLCEAHKTLKEDGKEIDIRKKRKGSSTVWLWMSRIARAYERHGDWEDKELAREFMQTRLGRLNGKTFDNAGREQLQTFLTELSPVPEKKTGEPRWFGELRTGSLSQKLLAEREARIKGLLRSEKPKVVICYGLGKRQQFSQLLNVVRWDEVAKKVFKAPNDNFFLLPFFGHGQKIREITQGLVSYPLFYEG